MDYIAHTPPKGQKCRKPHTYKAHIEEVFEYGSAIVSHMLQYCSLGNCEKSNLLNTMYAAFMLHDMGKLDENNQLVLQGKKVGKLEIDHIEAGVAIADLLNNQLLGWLIRGHHFPGLPSKQAEKFFMKQLSKEIDVNFNPYCLRGLRHKRTKEDAFARGDYVKHYNAIKRTDSQIAHYKEMQLRCGSKWPELEMKLPQEGLICRLLLSCLVDADHESTARYIKNEKMPKYASIDCLWAKRLDKLNSYVKLLSSPNNKENIRQKLRDEFYNHCSYEPHNYPNIVMCSAPVGLGKTTSVMAYLLRKAIESNSSRIVIVAPFSNIIDQTVERLREAVVLNGEDPNQIVVAHHHKAEFSDESMRQYTTLWQAPVIVTTAVQFFETIASAHPSKLRKLHSIVGASIFIDESHASLPAELLNVSWHWLKKLAYDWNCNIVFSSGSIVEFWNDEYIVGENKKQIPDICPTDIKKKAANAETVRVGFRTIVTPLSLTNLVEKLSSYEILNCINNQEYPSVLVILNTVQSSAILAKEMAEANSDNTTNIKAKKILYLSTALAPKDRQRIIKEIRRRQKDSEWKNKPWYLIATSCVEAGIDLDFTIGFRERASVTSFLQIAGRINRHSKRNMGLLYDFTIVPEDGLSIHPGFKESSEVFKEMWDDIKSLKLPLNEISTKAIRKEFSRFPSKKEDADCLLSHENKLNFQEVDKLFKVIKTDTATVIIDDEIVTALEKRNLVNWHTIQDNSIQLWSNKIRELGLKPIKNCKSDSIYSWTDMYKYDPLFLGYMAGLLDVKHFFEKNYGVI